MKRLFLSMSLLVSISLLSSVVFAQAYSPKKMSPSEVIKLAVYDRAPISFEYPLLKTTRVLNRSRLDFEQTYDIDFETFNAALIKAYKKQLNIGNLDAALFPNAKTPKLKVVGIGTNPSRATLTAPDLYFMVDFELRSNDQGQTVVLINSAIRSLIFGGAIPQRSPFRPVGTKPVRFRWN